MGVYLVGVHLNGVYLTGMHPTDVRLINVHLTGVYLIGMYLTGMYLTGMYLTGMHLTGCISNRHTSRGRACAPSWVGYFDFPNPKRFLGKPANTPPYLYKVPECKRKRIPQNCGLAQSSERAMLLHVKTEKPSIRPTSK
jgi:hypothetical protein